MTIDTPGAEQTAQLRRLWQEAFGDSDAFLNSFFSLAFAPERCRCVTAENRIVAALYWFDCTCRGEKMAYLYAVATAEGCRGKGLCRALMEDTHDHLRKLGYQGTVLVPASERLRQMYGKMGYLPGTTVSELTGEPGETAVDIQALDAGEYERRRRALMPSGGVLQEGALTALLQDQCGLFGGEDFLLAAWVEDGVLHAEELLGDQSAAPGVLRALGAEKGIFRIPGEKKPFAMYCPLTENCPKPGYFGISFG